MTNKLILITASLFVMGCAGTDLDYSCEGDGLKNWRCSNYGAVGIYNKMVDLNSPSPHNPYLPSAFSLGIYFVREDKLVWQPLGPLDPDQQPALQGLPLSESQKDALMRFDKRSFEGEVNICDDSDQFDEQLAVLKEILQLYDEQGNATPWKPFDKVMYDLVVPAPMKTLTSGSPRRIKGEAKRNGIGGYKTINTLFGTYNLYKTGPEPLDDSESDHKKSSIETILSY